MNLDRQTVRTLAVCALLIGGLSVRSAMAARSTQASAARIESALHMLSLEACETQCSYTGCPAGHANSGTSQGTNTGEIHSCATSVNECLDHKCGGEEFDDLESLIAQADITELADLEGRLPNFILNKARRAVQVLGCRDQVVLSIPLTQAQQHALSIQ